jgi:hypothetical protein
MRKSSFVLALLVALPLFASSSDAEKLIGLEQAKLVQQQLESSLAQMREMHDQGLISKSELTKIEVEAGKARLETQKAQIALANELPSFRVVSAIKSIKPSGEIEVAVKLRPLAGAMGGLRRMFLVSLKGEKAIIAEPYQHEVTVVGGGAEVSLQFRLLKDVDEVTLLVMSGTRAEETPILLQRNASATPVRLSSPTFSVEGVVGEKVEYAVDLERFADTSNDLRMQISGLPPSFNAEWVDTESKAKVNSVRFREGQEKMQLYLRVYLPTQSDPAWFDKVLPFEVVAYDQQRETDAGRLGLQLHPVGAPRLALASDNLLVQVASPETKTIHMFVDNTGGAEARDVVLEADFPVGLQGTFEPRSIDLLRPRERREITLHVATNADTMAGEYTFRVKAKTKTRMIENESPEQTFRVEVRSSGGRLLTTLLGGVFFIGTLGAVAWGVKTIRR